MEPAYITAFAVLAGSMISDLPKPALLSKIPLLEAVVKQRKHLRACSFLCP